MVQRTITEAPVDEADGLQPTVDGVWQRVVFGVECEPDGLCPVCGDVDYADCGCPGPTQEEEFEYREINGELWARARKNPAEAGL